MFSYSHPTPFSRQGIAFRESCFGISPSTSIKEFYFFKPERFHYCICYKDIFEGTVNSIIQSSFCEEQQEISLCFQFQEKLCFSRKKKKKFISNLRAL